MQTDKVWFSSRLTSGMQGGKGKKFLSKSGARGRTKKGSTKFGRRKTRSATAVILCNFVLVLLHTQRFMSFSQVSVRYASSQF